MKIDDSGLDFFPGVLTELVLGKWRKTLVVNPTIGGLASVKL